MPVATMFLRFVQLLPKVPPDIKFNLKDLPGSGKRIDILCRDLAACFDWAPDTWPKRNLELLAVFSNLVTLRFKSPERKLPIGERGWAEIIRCALKEEPIGFVTFERKGLERILKELTQEKDSKVWMLHEEGIDVYELQQESWGTRNSFILGDHEGFDSYSIELMEQYGVQKVSLGKISYLSSHCIAMIISKFEGMK